MNAGIYSNISNADYHKDNGLSASGLKLLARSPAHYKYTVREETPAMKIGSAVHTKVLQPELFEAEYTVAIDIDRRTKAGKEAWNALEESGKTVLKEDESWTVSCMAKAIHRHSFAGSLVCGGVAEQSIAWEYNLILDEQHTEILLKARPDYIKPVGSGYVCVDIKTTRDARDSFVSDSFKLGYHLQAAHYMRGLASTDYGTPRAFIFIAVESDPPYGVNCYEADQDFLNRGYEETLRLYELYARCVRDDSWPCYEEIIQKLGLPRWAA